MQKIFLITNSLLLFSLNIFCQELCGIYRFSYPELEHENVLYINFKGNNFVGFSLGSNTKVLDGTNELKEVGNGKYSFDKDNIILDFKTDTTTILPYIYDSISVSYSSKENQLDIKLSVIFNSFLTKFEQASIIIETPLKEYVEILTRNIKKIITLPQGSIIKSIKLAAIGMPLKHLPFDVNFNSIDYVFFAIDNKAAIINLKDQILSLKIKENHGEVFYNFGHNRFLKKIDDKELEFLNNLSKGDEPRLKILLNY